MKRTRLGSDDGAMLIFALIIITVIALVTGAILVHGSANFEATVTLRKVASTGYVGDAAAKAAISNIELGGTNATDVNTEDGKGAASYPSSTWVYDNAVDGTGCFGWNSSDGSARSNLHLSKLDAAATTSAVVTCAPVAGTGAFDAAGGVQVVPGTNSLVRALTILGTSGSDTLSVGTKSTDFLVHGGIASNANINVTRGQMLSDGPVQATSCSNPGSITSTPAVVCNKPAGFASDPNVTSPLAAVPTTSGGAVNLQDQFSGCTFQPGYYDDAAALSTAVNACNPAVFAPGDYYFDFHDDTADAMNNTNVMSNDANNTWSISTTVIGGTQTGSTCVSPYASTANTNTGVRFVFGGSSRIYLDQGADLELCGNYSPTSPPIVLYGLKAGSTAAAVTPATPLTGSSVSTNGSNPAFVVASATPSNLASVDGFSAAWMANTASNSNSNASLSVSSLTIPSGIPKGSILTSATVKVWHQETGTYATAPSLVIKDGSATQTATLTQNPAMAASAPVTLSTAVTKSLANAIHDGTALTASPSIAVTASTSVPKNQNPLNAMTMNVDAIQLQITYIPPALRGQTDGAMSSGNSNCLILATGSSGACDFVSTKTSGNPKATFVAVGASYLPLDSLTMNLCNNACGSDIQFRGGLVARSLTSSGWPQYAFTQPFASIPNAGPGPTTVVDLQVYVCAKSTTCSTSTGTLRLTARVAFVDNQDAQTLVLNATPSHRQVQVLSWAEQR